MPMNWIWPFLPDQQQSQIQTKLLTVCNLCLIIYLVILYVILELTGMLLLQATSNSDICHSHPPKYTQPSVSNETTLKEQRNSLLNILISYMLTNWRYASCLINHMLYTMFIINSEDKTGNVQITKQMKLCRNTYAQQWKFTLCNSEIQGDSTT